MPAYNLPSPWTANRSAPRVFRKLRRVPQSNAKADPLTSRRPDYQDLLLSLRLWVWLKDGKARTSLVEPVAMALDPNHRERIGRYGGLSLGESSHLVNAVSARRPEGRCGSYVGTTADF